MIVVITIVVILGTILLLLPFDIYIYRRILVKYNIGTLYRRVFVAYSATTYLFFIVIITYLFSMVVCAELGTKLNMWSLYVFLINLVPKFIMLIFSLLNDIIAYFIKREFRILNYIGAACVVVVVAMFIYGATWGRCQIEVKYVDVVNDKIPDSFDGYRIAFFSDLHLGSSVNKHAMIEKLIEEVNRQDVDLVLNGGDLVHLSHLELTHEVLEQFENMRARDGIFSVLGNHDFGHYYPNQRSLPADMNIDLLSKKLDSINWKWLFDSSVFIHRGADSISLTGITYPDELGGFIDYNMDNVDITNAYKDVDSTSFNVTLSHDPRLWDMVLENGIGDITLSGHVHAMQFKLKFGDWVFSPAEFIYDRWSGEYRSGNRILYINDGIGCVLIPMRIGAKPELTIIELKKN